MVRLLITVLLVMLAVYIIILLLLYFSQTRLLFYPMKVLETDPGEIGLKYETVSFQTKDQIIISAWYLPCPDADKVLLFCHGNAGNISHRLDSLKIFHQLGLNVLIFDYRGYGRSGGRVSETGTYLDVQSAWAYLRETRGFRSEDIILFGRSLGGAIAAQMAGQTKAAALIIESSFTSVPDLAVKIYPFLPVRLICRYKYPTIEYISRVKCPVLIVHSLDDELIPFINAQKLYTAAPKGTKLLKIRGSHNQGFSLSISTYTIGLQAFLNQLSQK